MADYVVKYPRILGRPRETWIQYLVFVPLLLVVLAPVIVALIQSFSKTPLYDGAIFDASSYVRLFADEHFGTVILNSLALAAMTTLISVVAGVLLAIVLVRVQIPGGRLMGGLLLWPKIGRAHV